MTNSIEDILLSTSFSTIVPNTPIDKPIEPTKEDHPLHLLSEEQVVFIEDIFQQIKITNNSYGMALRNLDQEANYLSELIEAVISFNLNKNNLTEGINYVKQLQSKILFSPIEFAVICGLCKHNLINVLSDYPAIKAHVLAANLDFSSPLDKWPHLVIREAADRTGWNLLRNKDAKYSFPVFEKFYKEALTQAAKGMQFIHTPPPIPLDLKCYPRTPEEKIRNKKGISDLRKIISEN